MSLFDKLQANRHAKINEEKNAGATFLAENRKKEGIVELPNGIQYQVLKEGSGARPDVPFILRYY